MTPKAPIGRNPKMPKATRTKGGCDGPMERRLSPRALSGGESVHPPAKLQQSSVTHRKPEKNVSFNTS
ncbi:hypothetical protein GWI33_021256 [Rhynchophorus ferrugineus]|uniref:Uncharacterized protein n=1 Tax=Rhynchophorus ferrugineus TaxID=354439 RepID=A0A834HN14_RHYFE|nr:hypothetical protein GWI33_021256 [Rhynchophorus ferrugineus]